MALPRTLYDFSLDELRERAALAKKTIDELRALLGELLDRGDLGASSANGEDSDHPTWEDVMRMVHEGLNLVTTLLPGMVGLSPETRAAIQAQLPDPETLRAAVESLPPPDQLPEEVRAQLAQARESYERGQAIHDVKEAMASLIADLHRVEKAFGEALLAVPRPTKPGNN